LVGGREEKPRPKLGDFMKPEKALWDPAQRNSRGIAGEKKGERKGVRPNLAEKRIGMRQGYFHVAEEHALNGFKGGGVAGKGKPASKCDALP